MRSTVISASLFLFTMACGGDDAQTDCVMGENLEDQDCDGVGYADDCDDFDPNSTFIADDEDCDTVLTEDDCDDTDADMPLGDADCDGTLTSDDCDDNDPK